MVKKKVFLIFLLLFSINSLAIEWICATQENIINKYSISGRSGLGLTLSSLRKSILPRIYSGEQILYEGKWLNGCMFNASNPDTMLAFSEPTMLGSWSAQKAEDFANKEYLFTNRTIKIVKSGLDVDMIDCVNNNKPAIGFLTSGTSINYSDCFIK